jgi:TonB family protein
MDEYRKSLSNAFFFSIALHTALLGGAIAFAHYGSLLRGQDFLAITVSLVSDRGAGETGAAAGTFRTRQKPSPEQIPSRMLQDLLPEKTRRLDDVAPLAATTSDDENTAPSVPGGTTDAGGAAGSADRDAGNPTSVFSKEQWQQLSIAIERAKNYPRFARERGIEGTVLVRFKVLPTGEIEKVNVIKSSGSDILDTASVRTVYRAAPMPYVNGWVEVPMSYVLK